MAAIIFDIDIVFIALFAFMLLQYKNHLWRRHVTQPNEDSAA